MNGYRADLLSNAGAGNGTAHQWPGGKGYFVAETSSWSAGSAKLQMQTPQGSWIDVPSVSLSANGAVAIDLPAGMVRAVVATSTAVYAWAIRI